MFPASISKPVCFQVTIADMIGSSPQLSSLSPGLIWKVWWNAEASSSHWSAGKRPVLSSLSYVHAAHPMKGENEDLLIHLLFDFSQVWQSRKRSPNRPWDNGRGPPLADQAFHSPVLLLCVIFIAPLTKWTRLRISSTWPIMLPLPPGLPASPARTSLHPTSAFRTSCLSLLAQLLHPSDFYHLFSDEKKKKNTSWPIGYTFWSH